MHELFIIKKPKKTELLQMVEPYTKRNATRNTTRNDRSGYIWDYAEMPLNIPETRLKELEKTWSEIPKKYTQYIKKLLIYTSQRDISTGQYFGFIDTLIVNVGCDNTKSGTSYVLQHEVHHNMWRNVQTISQKTKWEYGVLKIMLETGRSPTVYSDTFAPSAEIIDQLREQRDELTEYKKNVVNGIHTIDTCYPNYDGLKKDLNKHSEQASNLFNGIYSVSKDVMRKKEQNVQKIKQQYDSLSEEEKTQLLKTNYNVMSNALYDRCKFVFGTIFYNESHSVTGGYIYAEKSTRDFATTHTIADPTDVLSG